MNVLIQWGSRFVEKYNIEYQVNLPISYTTGYSVAGVANPPTLHWSNSYVVNAQVTQKSVSGFCIADDIPQNNYNYITIGY